MDKKVYISGPMRGYPELNYPMFDRLAELWRSKGFEVLNPAENFEGRKDVPYEDCIKKDLEQLEQECSAIAMMPGWEPSVGARKELGYALDKGYKVFDAIEMNELEPTVCRRQLVAANERYGGVKQPLAIKSLELVNKTRQAEYGAPKDDFKRASGMLASLGYQFQDPLTGDYRPLAPRDIPVFMICVKTSRMVNKFTDEHVHEDSILDMHGYLNTLEQLYEGKI